MESLDQLQKRVPLVSDKLLVDLVNGIQVSKGLIDYRKSRGFFGKLLDGLTGENTRKQALLEGNFIAGQEALYNWVLELTDSLRISQVALKITQNSLLEARNAIRNQEKSLSDNFDNFVYLSENLSQLASVVHKKISNLEGRIQSLEIKNSARDDFERIIAQWNARQIYQDLPWVFQVVFLAREIFYSNVAIYETRSGDCEYFRHLLTSKIIAESKGLPENFFDLQDLYEQAYQQLRSVDIELVESLLEVRFLSKERLRDIPYHYTLSTTLDFFGLPAHLRPENPAECAIKMCQTRLSHIDYVTDIEDFVNNIVHEAANDSITILSRGLEI